MVRDDDVDEIKWDIKNLLENKELLSKFILIVSIHINYVHEEKI